ncbi:MAG: hypothetical protein ACI910_000886 [Oleispira sp.]|jgi:hypothetical protein
MYALKREENFAIIPPENFIYAIEKNNNKSGIQGISESSNGNYDTSDDLPNEGLPNDNLFQDTFAETVDQLADQITLLARQERQYENRSVSCYQDDDGMWIIKAKLPAEEGGLIAKALKELGDRLADSNADASNADASNVSSAKETLKNSAKSVSAETFLENQHQEMKEDEKEKLTFPQRRALPVNYASTGRLAKPRDWC